MYYGIDFYIFDIMFLLGLEESDFLYDVVIWIVNFIGEFVEMWLSVKVLKLVVKSDVNELIIFLLG